MRRLVHITALLAGLAACGTPTTTEPTPTPGISASTPASAEPTVTPTASRRPVVVDVVADHLEVPWGVAFLPDGVALITERDSGRVLSVTDGQVREVRRVTAASPAVEGGLLGIAVSPTYEEDPLVFLYATTASDNRVLRGTYDGKRLGQLEPILTEIPKGFIHDGGRLLFGPDGFLYVSTGDTGESSHSQDPASLGGKILRITVDGKPAPGNPDPASPVWSLGHRNVQGLAFDDAGNLWASEFGQDTWDELNLIRPGANYGWPLVEGKGSLPEYQNPQQVWRTADASPSGLAYHDGRLWMASLRGQRLWRIDVDGATAVRPKAFFIGKYGRMRAVTPAPDGTLWVTTSNRDGRGSPTTTDDRILSVRP